jgi:hypothetical protein
MRPGEFYGDPRDLENPIEAGIELADLTEKWLPGLKRRSLHLSIMGLAWTLAMAIIAAISAYSLWGLLTTQASVTVWDVAVSLIIPIITIPSMALGAILLLLAIQESRFLPHLDQASKAMAALGTRPAPGKKPASSRPKEKNGRMQGPAIAGIVGSSMHIGDLVPVVGRMTLVASAVLTLILFGLAYLIVAVILLVIYGSYLLLGIFVEMAIFAIFVGPAVHLYKDLSHDHEFYNYYTQRHQAVAEATAMGTPPVPEGKDHIARFDTFLRSVPAMDEMLSSPGGGVRKNIGKKGRRFDRLYHGPPSEDYGAILVRAIDGIPTRDDIDAILDEAKALAEEEGIDIARVVALVTADVEDIDDDLYEHIIEMGRRARPGECVLQLVMEVDGTYSLVPYVAM